MTKRQRTTFLVLGIGLAPLGAYYLALLGVLALAVLLGSVFFLGTVLADWARRRGLSPLTGVAIAFGYAAAWAISAFGLLMARL